VEKGINIDPIHVATQEDAKSIEIRTFSDVGVQTTSVDTTINKETSVHEKYTIPKVNQENYICTIRKIHATKTPYQHPNHKSRHLN
jgi:hypothetical protein